MDRIAPIDCPPSRRSPPAQRGVALLIVITVLVVLVMIAVPFVLAMRHGQENTEALAARERADLEAGLLLQMVKQMLARTHPAAEVARQGEARPAEARSPAGTRGGTDASRGAGSSTDTDPAVDTVEEYDPGSEQFRRMLEEAWRRAWDADPLLAARGKALQEQKLGPSRDDRGSVWDASAVDAQACVHVNGASPFLLGNLLGAAMLADDLDSGSTEVPVENVVSGRVPGFEGFPRANGALRVGREVITYTSFDGRSFRGCTRGALPGGPLGLNGSPEDHKAGTPVIAYDAFQLAVHMIAAEPGRLAPFENLAALRRIADWGPGIPAERLKAVEPYLTVWARRETTEWLASQLVMNSVGMAGASGGQDEVMVRDDVGNPSGSTAYFNPGTLVRVGDGVRSAWQVVQRIGDPGGGQSDRLVLLAGSVGAGDPAQGGGLTFAGGRTRMEALAPTPININTAPREVLYAVLANLHLRTAEPGNENVVHPALAWTLAERLVQDRSGALRVDAEGLRTGGPFRRVEDFGRWLEEQQSTGALTRTQRQAIYRNAVNPHDADLAFGTTSWCFRTLDVYHVEARVSVHDRIGNQLATATHREVVEVGADRTASWTLDSQDDFELRLSMGSGAKWFASYPRGVMMVTKGLGASVQPPPRAPKALLYGVYPSAQGAEGSGGQDMGDVRLAPARVRMPGEVVYERHFDNTHWTAGWFTEGRNGFSATTRARLIDNGVEARPRPFSVSFWWRSMSDADWTAFDCGMSRFMNRYAIFVQDGDEGRELVFRTCGGTLEEKAAECFVPLSRIGYQAGEWFHIQASASGEDPALMELLVDGVAVGSRRHIGFLTASCSADDTDLAVDTTAGFHPRGALVIGTEIVEYDQATQDSFRECVRGARGTQAGTWAEGTPVRMLGYAMPLLQDLMAGGAYLTQRLGRMAAVRVDNVDDTGSVTITVNGAQVPMPIWGIAPDRTTFAATLMDGSPGVQPLWGMNGNEAIDAFGPRGYAVLGCATPTNADGSGTGGGGTSGVPVGGWEIVSYVRNGNSLTITRYVSTPSRDAPEPYFLCTHYWQKDPQYSDGTVWPCFMVPISVQAAGGGALGSDYMDPSNPADRTRLARYNGDGDARWLLGTTVPQGWNECGRYSWLDRTLGAGLQFVQERFLDDLVSAFFRQRDFATDPNASGGGTGGGSGGGTDPGTGNDGGAASPDTDPAEEGTGEPEPAPPVDDGEAEGGASGPAREEGDGDPGNRLPSDDEPTPDSSGGGSSNKEEGDGPVVPEVPRPETTYEYPMPPAPQADGSGLYFEPEFGTLQGWSRTYFRGVQNTLDLDHDTAGGDKQSLFMPCFRVWENYAGIPRRAGRNDVITITDGAKGQTARHQALLRWGDPGSDWVALDEPLEGVTVRALDQDANEPLLDHRWRPRVLKFPCGELPEELPEQMDFTRSTITNSSVVTAFIDELFVWQHAQQPMAVLVNNQAVTPGDEELLLAAQPPAPTLEGTPGHDADVGILALGGELIVYRGTRVEGGNRIALERCVRGALGTKARAHPPGATGRFLFDVPVSALSGNLARDAKTIPLVHARNWPQEGLVRIVGASTAELAHYTALNGSDLLMPGAMDADEDIRDRGLFRGRFGTQALEHERDTLVVWQPFRHWDRYTGRRVEDERDFGGFHDHPESSYLELGKRTRGALWQRIAWVEGFDQTLRAADSGGRGARGRGTELDTFMDVLVAMRFHPGVPWDTKDVVDLRSGGADTPQAQRANRRQSLLVFADMDGENRLDIESETADLRVYFRFRPNAWVPQDLPASAASGDLVFANAWKRSPRLQEVTLEYLNRTVTRGGRSVFAR